MRATCRVLTADDQPELGSVVASLAAEPRRFGPSASPKPSAGWRSRLAHPCRLRAVGVFVDGLLVGVARLVPAGPERDELLVAVAPAHRGVGLGAALVGAALEFARQTPERTVVAAVERGNSAAMALCAAHRVDLRPIGPGRVEVTLGAGPLRRSA